MKNYLILGALAVGGYLLFGKGSKESTSGTSEKLSREEMTQAVANFQGWNQNVLNDFQRFSDYDVLQVYEADIKGNFIAGSREIYMQMLKKYGWA